MAIKDVLGKLHKPIEASAETANVGDARTTLHQDTCEDAVAFKAWMGAVGMLAAAVRAPALDVHGGIGATMLSISYETVRLKAG